MSIKRSGRAALAEVGRKNTTEDAAAEIGAKFIRDIVIKALVDAGVENAPGVKVSLVNGEELVILGPDDPNLSRPASEVRRDTGGRPAVTLNQSAKGGM